MKYTVSVCSGQGIIHCFQVDRQQLYDWWRIKWKCCLNIIFLGFKLILCWNFFFLLSLKIHTMCVGGGKLYSAGSDQAIISWNLENLTLHKKIEVCYHILLHIPGTFAYWWDFLFYFFCRCGGFWLYSLIF